MIKSTHPTVYEVAVAALLKDIGKLVQRGNKANPVAKVHIDQWFSKGTADFFNLINDGKLPWPRCIDRNWVMDLAISNPTEGSSQSPSFSNFVKQATEILALVSCEDNTVLTEQAWSKIKQKKLKAIVPSLKLPEFKNSPTPVYHYPSRLDADSIMASDVSDNGKKECMISTMYENVWSGFQKDWTELLNKPEVNDDPKLFEEGLLSLMEKWLWSVSSTTSDEQLDISLFDHSRMVAAVSIALFNNHNLRGISEPENQINNKTSTQFRILIGDLSGIQSTLFRFSRESVPRLNRILRGRSLRFQLITDSAIRHVIKKFNLTWSSVLQSAGGRFLILAPDLGEDAMNSHMDHLRKCQDAWLVENYSGDLGYGLAVSKPFPAKSLVQNMDEGEFSLKENGLNSVRDKIFITSATAKLQQFQGPAQKIILKNEFPLGACIACGIRPAKSSDQENFCYTCNEENILGRHYPKSNSVVIDEEKSDKKIFGLSYNLKGCKEQNQGVYGWTFRGNSQFGPSTNRPGYCYVPTFNSEEIQTYKCLDGHEDIKVDDIKTFEVLAKLSKGNRILALLKADVDRLGELFLWGNPPWNITKTSALSRMFECYFSLRLPKVLESCFPNIYTVYAGGDDLMLLGPWNDIFDFAVKLRKDFNDFSKSNPSVSLSAGIAIFNVKSPVAMAAREVDDRLEHAKVSGRNKISAIEDRPMSWDTYIQALEDARKMGTYLNDNILNSATLYKFLKLWDAINNIRVNKASPDDYAWRAKLGYILARIFPSDENRCETQNEAFNFIIKFFGLNQGLEGNLSNCIPGAKLALTHAIYENR